MKSDTCPKSIGLHAFIESAFSLSDDGVMLYINQLNEEASGVLDNPGQYTEISLVCK